ncbi:Sphingolipid C9-methyltransferase 2, partial [Ascosphaera pollenicola]
MACFSSLRRNKKEDKEEKTEKLKDSEKQRLSSDGTNFKRPYLKPELPPERHEPVKNAAPKKGILKKPQPKPEPDEKQQSVPRAVARSEERKRNRAEALAAREKQQLADLAEAIFQPAMTGEQLAALKIIEKSNVEAAAAAEEEKQRKAHEHSHRRFSIPQSVAEDDEDEMNGIR